MKGAEEQMNHKVSLSILTFFLICLIFVPHGPKGEAKILAFSKEEVAQRLEILKAGENEGVRVKAARELEENFRGILSTNLNLSNYVYYPQLGTTEFFSIPGRQVTSSEEGEREGNKSILRRVRLIVSDLSDSSTKRLKELLWKETDDELKKMITDILQLKNSERWGYLYLLRSQLAETTESIQESDTYDLKLYDPLTQKISFISKVSLPDDVDLIDPRSIQYGAGKLFFHISIPYMRPTHKIFMLDLKRNEGKYKVDLRENTSDRVIPSYLVVGNALFFLSCDFVKRESDEMINDGLERCQLWQTSLHDDSDIQGKTLLDLKGVFKRNDTTKHIAQYLPVKNWLILSEYLVPNSYVERVIPYYYGISLETLEAHDLNEQEMQEIFAELKETKKGQCEKLTEGSGFFEKERRDVYPPQIRLGCFDQKELEFLLNDKNN